MYICILVSLHVGGRGSGGGVGERIQGFGNTPSNSSQDPNSITAQLSKYF